MWGIILRPWPDEPVFHAYDGTRASGFRWTTTGEKITVFSDFTRCGRQIASGTPWLPFKHVVKFGRPCKGCFPE